MSSTGSDSVEAEGSEAHAYFRAVEEAFIRLRGAPFLLSPEDWRVANGWWEKRIPLGLVERVLEKILRRREQAEGGETRRVRSLRYFDSAVTAAWKGVQTVAGSEEARQAPAIDLEHSLSALADSLPGVIPDRHELAERIRSLTGSTETVEAGLEALDGEMLERARANLDEGRRADLERRVEAGVERAGRRLQGADEPAARGRLEAQILRRELDLPLLSLFSPQARIDPE